MSTSLTMSTPVPALAGSSQPTPTQQASKPAAPEPPMSTSPGASPPAGPPPGGVVIPSWVFQVLPMIIMLVGASMVFAQQKADVDQLKTALIEIKSTQSSQQNFFVSRQIFDMKNLETEKTLVQLNQRLDKIENLLTGIYERLPTKRK